MVKLQDLVTVGRLTDFWEILREVNPETAIRDAFLPVRLIIMGPPGAGKRALALALSGGEIDGLASMPPVISVCDLADDVPTALPTADIYLYLIQPSYQASPIQQEQIRQLARRTGRVLAVIDSGHLETSHALALRDDLSLTLALDPGRVLALAPADRPQVVKQLIPRILALTPSLALALGRRLPPFRDPVADFLTAETSRVNAEFVLISTLPATLPIVGSIAAAGADLIVLTKNQAMLWLKLAVLYNRSIENRLQLFGEILPVVGAAFFWRSAARTIVAMVPGPIVAAPQAAIAYVGTTVAGKAAQHYYRWGKRPSPEILEQFRLDALQQLGTVSPLLTRFGKILKLP